MLRLAFLISTWPETCTLIVVSKLILNYVYRVWLSECPYFCWNAFLTAIPLPLWKWLLCKDVPLNGRHVGEALRKTEKSIADPCFVLTWKFCKLKAKSSCIYLETHVICAFLGWKKASLCCLLSQDFKFHLPFILHDLNVLRKIAFFHSSAYKRTW